MTREKPAYLALYERLRDEMIRGDRKRGEKLPSRRQLSRDEGVSPITVEHSLELLVQEGYIEARPKSGCYVLYREADGFVGAGRRPEPAAWEPGGESAFSPENPAGATGAEGDPFLSAEGEEDARRFPFSVLARTMRRVLSDYGERLLERSPGKGKPELREALCRYLGRNRGLRVEPEQVIIGSGAEYLYGLVVELLGRNRVYAMELPSYAKIEQVYRARGVRCELLPLGRDGIVTEALSASRADVLHITPYRSFPTGVTAGASKRREYLKWAERPGRFIVEDDFESEYSLLRKPEETIFARAEGQNVLYLNTFSRTVSPSLRVGYMVLPRHLAPVYEMKAGFYSCPVPVFEQLVLAELLEGGDFERHINRIRRAERARARG